MNRIECTSAQTMCEVVSHLELLGLRFVVRQAGGDEWVISILN